MKIKIIPKDKKLLKSAAVRRWLIEVEKVVESELINTEEIQEAIKKRKTSISHLLLKPIKKT